MKYYILFVLVVIFEIQVIFAVEYKDCGGSAREILNVSIDPPCGKYVCTFKRGSTVKASVEFIANTTATSLTAKLYGIFRGIWVRLRMPEDMAKACFNSGLTCPLEEGKTYIYIQTGDISKDRKPITDVEAAFVLEDETGDDILCLQMPVEVV